MAEEMRGRLTGRMALVWAGTVLFAALGAGEANAQKVQALEGPATGTQMAPTQRDVFVSGGVGWGSLGFPGDLPRQDGISGNLEVATTVEDNDWLRAGLAISGWTRREGGASVTFGALTGMTWLFPFEQGIFLTGGVGRGKVWESFEGDRTSQSGWSGIVGGGYEVELSSDWAISPWANLVGYRISSQNADFLQAGLGITYSN